MKKWTVTAKKIRILLVITLALGLLATACTQAPTQPASSQPAAAPAASQPAAAPAAPAAPAKPVELIFGHAFPAQHHVSKRVVEPFIKEVEEKTNGRVKFTLHAGGSLVNPPGSYEAVVNGVVDATWALQGYTPGRFPLTEVIEMPFMFTSAEEATQVLWKLYEQSPALQKEYGDVKVITLWAHDTGHIYTKGKPVRKLEDLKGLRLRFPGPMQGRILEAYGATPVGMPAPDIYDSIDRGVIDGVAIGRSAMKSFRLHEVVNYSAESHFYVAPMALVMNKEAWNRISPQDQQIIDGLMGERLALVAARDFEVENKAALELLKSSNVEMYEVPADEIARWRQAAAPVMEQWFKDMEKAGLPGRELYDQMLKLAGKS